MNALVAVLGVLIVLAMFYASIGWAIDYIANNYPESLKYILVIIKGFRDGNVESLTQMVLDEFTNSTGGDTGG